MENLNTKKTWVTPKLLEETIKETEGKDTIFVSELGTFMGHS